MKPTKKDAAAAAKKSGKPQLDAWPKVLAWFRKKKERAGNVKKLFTELDADGSGDIDLKELVDGMKKEGLMLSDEEFEAYFNALDLNGDGQVTLMEFTKAIRTAITADN